MKFKEIKKTEHYKIYHEKSFGWNEVLRIIIPAKVMRKKGNQVEYKNKKYYITGKIKNNILWITNAKMK